MLQVGFWKHRKEGRYSRRGWKWLWNSRRYSFWRRLSWFHGWGSYKCYFEKSICQNIPKHSVIVIDNAPYHSKNMENYPTSKWWKQQFVDWLTEKNITFPEKALRAELWTLVKSEREKFPDKVMETVAKEHGHEIFRLPPTTVSWILSSWPGLQRKTM